MWRAITQQAGAGDVTLASTGGHDILIGIQNVISTPYADTFVGIAHDNLINGGPGAPSLPMWSQAPS